MKLRIAIWAIAGFLIAGFWALYFLSAHFVLKGAVPVQAQPIAFILARITCPIAFASFYFHLPIGVFLVLLVNAVTYSLIGLFVETLRRHHPSWRLLTAMKHQNPR